MKINYGLIAFFPDFIGNVGQVIYFCGYEHPPTKEDIQALKHELETNPEFGLVGVDFSLKEATEQYVEYVNCVRASKTLEGGI